MEPTRLLLVSTFLTFLVSSCYGSVLFSSLKSTLIVNASPKPGQVLEAGVDKITVTWGLNQSIPAGVDSTYKTIKVKLCYAPVSQVDRAWRKTVDDLHKDKTCQFNIVARPYNSANKTLQSFEWIVERDVPTATYFIRAYAYDSEGLEVTFGQTTDAKKANNLFVINAITGRHLSLDIASICFSAFSVLALFGFFFIEKRKAKGNQGK
ncbi:hypothetical protein K2173_001055 [Erythroxylum novogranatense]|uniref:High-affinity nitrate transporter n=1 Tax=Erythroxylum novogranatense TaxID=1862640 RepID=A0AAV8SJ70_9ROSI|nr:hypothetical protein K2173_001055 [Erythroxylum novogranatense]